jgi:hypothetical protein
MSRLLQNLISARADARPHAPAVVSLARPELRRRFLEAEQASPGRGAERHEHG